MKQRFALILVALALMGTFAVSAQTLPKDGVYYAEQDKYDATSGWKAQVILEIKGGKLVTVNWNAVSKMGTLDKKAHAAAGLYGMAKAAKQGEWHVQAARMEAELLKVQHPSKLKLKADGKADAVTGVSMNVGEFAKLATQALASAPVEKGSYKKDGWFFAKATAPDKSGYFATALITVVNGRIVNANWNGIHKDGGDSRFVRAEKGSYKMNAPKGEWNIQAARVEEALVKAQNPSGIVIKADGKTDAITGVSVTVNDFFALAAQALKAAQ